MNTLFFAIILLEVSACSSKEKYESSAPIVANTSSPNSNDEKAKTTAESKKKKRTYKVYPLNDGTRLSKPGMGQPRVLNEKEFNKKYLTPGPSPSILPTDVPPEN